MGCDLDDISEVIAAQLYSERYCEMKSELQVINKLLQSEHDLTIIESVFVVLLKLFRITLDKLANYVKFSLPELTSLGNSLWAFVPCKCENSYCSKFIVKQISINVDAYSIDFSSSENIQISASLNQDRRVLTHVFVNLVRVYEGRWTSRSYSVSIKAHKMASIMSTYFSKSKKRAMIIVSSEDEENETKMKNTKNKYKKIKLENATNTPKLIPSVEKNYVTLCKTSLASYFKEKQALINQVTQFQLTKPNIDFIETDSKKLTEKIDELFDKKAHVEKCNLLDEDSSSALSEMEAIYKGIQSFKGMALKNISNCKKEMEEFVKEEEKRKRAEERLQAEEENWRLEEQKRQTENQLEKKLIDIAASVEAFAVQEQGQIEGEINENERLRRYYWKAIEIAAKFAVALEEFLPVLQPFPNYMLQDFKYKKAQARTAMESNNDAATSCIHHEHLGQWHGPPLPNININELPDLVNEIQQLALSNFAGPDESNCFCAYE